MIIKVDRAVTFNCYDCVGFVPEAVVEDAQVIIIRPFPDQLTPAQARCVAAVLTAAADEADPPEKAAPRKRPSRYRQAWAAQ